MANSRCRSPAALQATVSAGLRHSITAGPSRRPDSRRAGHHGPPTRQEGSAAVRVGRRSSGAHLV
jgi:hypothetical protein